MPGNWSHKKLDFLEHVFLYISSLLISYENTQFQCHWINLASLGWIETKVLTIILFISLLFIFIIISQKVWYICLYVTETYHWTNLVKWRVFWEDRIFCFPSVESADMRPKSASGSQSFLAVWACVGYGGVLEMLWLDVAENLVPARPSKLANHTNKAASSWVFHNVGSYFFITLCKHI